MGTNCGIHEDPSPVNLCDISLGFYPYDTMQNFCTILGPAGNSYRNEYCNLMSNAGEWGDPNSIDGSCFYNDCKPFQDFGNGCCNGCCGIIGGGLVCKRKSFTGDPVTCCFKDMDCTGESPASNPPQCYSDPAKQHTCADGKTSASGEPVPNHRSITSTDCQDVLLQYCSGTLSTDDPNSTDWLSRWTQNNGGPGSCLYALNRNLFRKSAPCLQITPPIIPGQCGLQPPFEIDAEGYFWGQRLITEAVSHYERQGFQIGTLPGFQGYNPWQDFLYTNVCCPYPGLCQDVLNVVCANKTAQRISLNPAVAQWCGCHLPEGEYQSYSTKFNIPPECTPMCNRSGTIPIVGINAEPIKCRQNICMIDGVTVNLINSQIGGGINFDQICGNCSGAQCSCIISGTTIDISNSTIGGNVIPINEGCGSFTCSQTNPGTTGPSTITVPCGTGTFNPYSQYDAEVAAAQAAANKTSWLLTLLIIGIALVLMFLIVLFIHPNYNIYPQQINNISPNSTPLQIL